MVRSWVPRNALRPASRAILESGLRARAARMLVEPMLSRRGQVPRGHILYDPWPVDAQDVPLGNVLKVWRWLRKRAGQGNWRAAVDAMLTLPPKHSLCRAS